MAQKPQMRRYYDRYVYNVGSLGLPGSKGCATSALEYPARWAISSFLSVVVDIHAPASFKVRDRTFDHLAHFITTVLNSFVAIRDEDAGSVYPYCRSCSHRLEIRLAW